MGKSRDIFESGDFEKMLDSSLETMKVQEGKLLSGKVTKIEDGFVYVDIGMKSIGKIPLAEFSDKEVTVGSVVEAILTNLERGDGSIGLSHEEVKRSEVKNHLKEAFEKKQKVSGVIVNSLRNGGYTVNLSGIMAHLPRNHIDGVKPGKSADLPINSSMLFVVHSMDDECNKIVVSLRGASDIDRRIAKKEFIEQLAVGDILEDCVVKSIAPYGAFISIGGGHDGLLHVTDISWKRVHNPGKVDIKKGTILPKVVILSIDKDTGNVSLGLKQLEEDPWCAIDTKLSVGSIIDGVVTNVVDYGAFIELEKFGIEGLVHVSELSWSSKNVVPSEVLSPGQKLKVMVLTVDETKKRVSVSRKRCIEDPRRINPNDYPFGREVEGVIQKINPFGLVIELDTGARGIVHVSDLSWTENGSNLIKNYKIDDRIKVKVLGISPDRNRLKLSVKHFTDNPYKDKIDGICVGSVVCCTVDTVLDTEIEVVIDGGLRGFVRKSEISMDKSQSKLDRFKPGDKVDAKVLSIKDDGSKIELSIARCEQDEHRQGMEKFSIEATSSGTTLSDFAD